MKKTLLTIVAFACALCTMNAQVDIKPAQKKMALSTETSVFPKGKLSLQSDMTTKQRNTRADNDIDAKVLTTRPGFDRNVYELTGLPAGETKVATAYTNDLLQRFNGNKITGIRTKLLANVDNTVTAWIMDFETAEVITEKKKMFASVSGKEIEINFDEPFVIDANKPFIVGYTIKLKADKGGITIVNNYTDYGLLLQVAGDKQIYDYSGQYPNAYLECITEGDAGLKANDVVLQPISQVRAIAGEEYELPFVFYNYGTNPVTKLDYTYTLDGVEHNESLNLQDGIPFFSGGEAVDVDVAPGNGGKYVVDFTITKVNDTTDEFPTDNSTTTNFLNLTEPQQRIAVMEEFTGTWCGWCTRGIVAVEQLKEAYEDAFIAICVHYGDEMQDDSYQQLLQYVEGFPSAILNRTDFIDPYYGSNNSIHDDVQAILAMPSEAKVGVSSELSEDKKTINIASTLQFSLNTQGEDYSMAYVVVEDGITGYEQTNYYAKEYASQTGLRLSDIPDDLKHLYDAGPAMTPDFNDVSRAIAGCMGLTGSLDGISFTTGNSYIHEYAMAVPSSVKDINNVSVVALLIDNSTLEIVNAAKAKLGEASWTAIEQVTDQTNANIQVNDGAININAKGAVQVYTIDGKLVSNVTSNGNVSIPTLGMNGVHLVRVVTANGIKVAKVAL